MGPHLNTAPFATSANCGDTGTSGATSTCTVQAPHKPIQQPEFGFRETKLVGDRALAFYPSCSQVPTAAQAASDRAISFAYVFLLAGSKASRRVTHSLNPRVSHNGHLRLRLRPRPHPGRTGPH